MAGNEGSVIVALDDDERVSALKSADRPIFKASERGKALYDLSYKGKPLVNSVQFFQSDGDLINIIKRHKAEVMIKGSDWLGKRIIGDDLVKIEFMNRMTDYSTTDIINRCRNGYTQNT